MGKSMRRRLIALSLLAGVLPLTAQTFTFSTLAGYHGAGKLDGVGNAAQFNLPQSIVSVGSSTLYVADSGYNTIRKVVRRSSHDIGRAGGRTRNCRQCGRDQRRGPISFTCGHRHGRFRYFVRGGYR
jgi:hypothetical protein